MGDLEEFKRQRALIAQHLAWLDQRIREIGDSPAAAYHEASEDASALPQLDPALVDASEGVAMRPGSGQQIRHAKIGCMAITLAAVLLFLFLLFGLPYLIDNDKLLPEDSAGSASGEIKTPDP